MEVLLSSPRGFCAGVVRAIDIVERCLLQFGPPIYVRHEIVHNPHVVIGLRQKGAVFVEEVDDVPPGQTIIFAAHGVSPVVRAAAKARNLRVIDATCPLVTKVHLEAIHAARQGYTIILIGHRGHDEVIGTMGEAPAHIILIETAQEAMSVQVSDPDMVMALTQTTLSVDDTADILKALRTRFPNLATSRKDDICYATSNRQRALKAIAQEVDMVLVIGAENSSNCNRLRELAADAGLPAHLISDPHDINPAWLEGIGCVGITSGASTPEPLVQAVVAALAPRAVRTIAVAEENVTFSLPRELRQRTVLPISRTASPPPHPSHQS
ncbi:MAG: 4-hydroxy-3-methylbut-2-enyl diphosphate reductase [Chloroflexi bacterium]|nr:4-hydroxy-3-methylbut-2-enyl diphosphate reductase [Chloroflexota bacterium]